MPTYEHFQQVKKATRLPDHNKVGACLTCRYWQAEEPRGAPQGQALVARVALCLQSELKPYALIVSGSSACNKWQEKPGIEPEAKAYAKEGEDD